MSLGQPCYACGAVIGPDEYWSDTPCTAATCDRCLAAADREQLYYTLVIEQPDSKEIQRADFLLDQQKDDALWGRNERWGD